jgi:hypothetical protein
MRPFLRKFGWILPVSLGLGLLLSLLDGGIFWIGWLAYSFMVTIGLVMVSTLWRSCGASRILGLILLMTVILRLGLGMAFSFILPPYGNDNEVHNAGYIFRDAYTRDTQAWNLASSSGSLWSAFDRSTSGDQYGGMLFLSGLLYRFISPDFHRPWLIILVGALIAAIGVILAWKAVRKVWGEPVAWGTAWIMALYPEAILMGSAQMREPFLITFVVMVFWGVVNWSSNWRTSAAWLAGGISGMMLFNPSIAVVAIIITSIWVWIREKGRLVARWWWIAGSVAVVLLAAFIFIGAVGGSIQIRGGPLATLLDWIHLSSAWDAYVLELNSGWIQNVFAILPASLHLPFVIGYGITQPLLPAAIADPAVWPMRGLGILRGLGWYALIPFLIYSLRPIWKMCAGRERLAWLWLLFMTWGWIILSSARAGGDQWDNPRYRVILLLFQAALAAQTLTWQRATHDRWLGRFLAVEGVFLSLFGFWYAARYTNWQAGQVHVFVIIGLIVIISSVILLGGWIADRRRVRRA